MAKQCCSHHDMVHYEMAKHHDPTTLGERPVPWSDWQWTYSMFGDRPTKLSSPFDQGKVHTTEVRIQFDHLSCATIWIAMKRRNKKSGKAPLVKQAGATAKAKRAPSPERPCELTKENLDRMEQEIQLKCAISDLQNAMKSLVHHQVLSVIKFIL